MQRIKIAAQQVSRSIDDHILIAVVDAAIKFQSQVGVVHQQRTIKLFFCQCAMCNDIVIRIALYGQLADGAINIHLCVVRIE